MPSEFGSVLQALLRQRGLSVRRLAADLHVEPPTLWGIIAGRRPVPPKRIAEIAVALGLQASERRRFEEAARLTQCPLEVRQLVDRLRAENKRLRAELARARPAGGGRR